MSYYSDEWIDVSFEDSELEALMRELKTGDVIPAVRWLALTEDISDDEMEELYRQVMERLALIDLSDLPKAGASGEAALRLREEEQLVQKGDLMANLEKNDPLRVYLEELASIPAYGDIQLLAEDLMIQNRKKEVDQNLLSRLLNLSLSLVVEMAQEYTGRGVLLMDLIQEGSLGLWTELPNYRFGEFEWFRRYVIHSYMAKAVIRQARDSGLGQKMRQAVEDYRMVDERLLSELGRNPTTEELAEQLHMSVEEVENVRKVLDSARMVGKAHAQPEPEEETQEDTQAVENTAYYQTRERVDELMSGLTAQESQLLNLRYGLDGKQPKTAQEVGKIMNLTVSEVVAMEAAALAKMRG